MKQVFSLVILFILCLACTSSSDKIRGNRNAENDKGIPANAIPALYFDYLHIKLRIDSAAGSFLFDTGFDNLCIDSTFYYENKMDYLSSSAGKIFGIGNAYQRLNLIRDTVDFSIGTGKYRTSFIPVLNLKPIGGDYVDGLLGHRHFSNNAVEINYNKGYICIHESIDSVDVSDYRSIHLKKIETHFFIPVTLKISDTITIKGNFLIDSASPGSTLTSSVVFNYGLNDKIRKKVMYYTMYGGIGGESAGYDFAADSLEISGFGLANVILSYSLDTAGLLAAEEYIGILGNNIIDRFDAIYDFRNNDLYLKPNDTFRKPYEFDRMGFSYVDRCKTMGGWIVSGMYENSPAEKEGLRIDDKIISVNETPVEDIAYEEQDDYFEEMKKVKFVVSRAGSLLTIEFELAPL